jgi:hypothetical protein
MNRLCLPQIAKDFPEFNWSEWKAQIETELRKKTGKRVSEDTYSPDGHQPLSEGKRTLPDSV